MLFYDMVESPEIFGKFFWKRGERERIGTLAVG